MPRTNWSPNLLLFKNDSELSTSGERAENRKGISVIFFGFFSCDTCENRHVYLHTFMQKAENAHVSKSRKAAGKARGQDAF